ncbi:MAG: MBOAT family protein, partial [Bacteroidetes bacterium]|nr:MBOAT family protein [Bacteroidota bacterium]
MIFNSIDFALFLPLVFCLYWLFNNNLRIQNIILLVSSYYFYASWDWRFLSLIIFSTLVDFYAGVCLSKYKSISLRKFILGLSIMLNLGLLGFFKYYNFFVEQFINAFTLLGQDVSVNSLNIILPVGISFYTFQSMSYTIDVYRKNIVNSPDLISFSSYVSFFPQLV